MRDIYSTMRDWSEAGKAFVLARVTKTWGSAPRGVGATMAIASRESFVGSVSGGCVEGAVVQEAVNLLESDGVRRLEYGVDDEMAWSVGLSCGGRIELLLDRFPGFSDEAVERDVGQSLLTVLASHADAAFVTIFRSEDASVSHLLVRSDGTFVGSDEHADYVPMVLSALRSHQSGWTSDSARPGFIHILGAVPRLLIVGAGEIARHLVRLAQHLGFETVVVDPRVAFSDPERFEVVPDRMIQEWPETAFQSIELTTNTYCVLLSHNPRIDDPALHAFLKSEARYIGALGSRKTHSKRCLRLRKAGFEQTEIERIRGPVGLNIGASTPAEIALAIVAEIVAVRRSQAVPSGDAEAPDSPASS